MNQNLERKYRINQRITAPQVRLVGEGINEVLPFHEALKKALAQHLDLIEVGPGALPPVVKMGDFKKFIYQEAKKERKKSRTESKLKEIRLSPIIAENDLNTKIERGSQFLAKGHILKVNIWMQGRLAYRPDLGNQKMEIALKKLETVAKVVAPPKWQSKNLLVATLAPK